MVIIMRTRSSGWLATPTVFLKDNGSFYDLNLGIMKRRIYKSSIDKEYRINCIVSVFIIPVLIAALITYLTFTFLHSFFFGMWK